MKETKILFQNIMERGNFRYVSLADQKIDIKQVVKLLIINYYR
jgi:hypothetical protein